MRQYINLISDEVTVEMQCEDTRCSECKQKLVGLKQDTCTKVKEKSISALLTVAPFIDFTSSEVKTKDHYKNGIKKISF